MRILHFWWIFCVILIHFWWFFKKTFKKRKNKKVDNMLRRFRPKTKNGHFFKNCQKINIFSRFLQKIDANFIIFLINFRKSAFWIENIDFEITCRMSLLRFASKNAISMRKNDKKIKNSKFRMRNFDLFF